MDLTVLPWLAAACYLIAAAPSIARLVGMDVGGRLVAVTAKFLALALHLSWLSGQLAQPGIGLATSLSLAAWTTALILIVAGIRQTITHLELLVLPLAAALVVIPVTTEMGENPLSPAVVLHILMSMLAYALVSLAATQALVYAWADHRLRQHRGATLGGLALPPLESLEDQLFLLISAGFLFLTLSLASGVGFIHDLQAQHLLHKTVLTVLAWSILGGLLVGRHLRGWRGQQAVRWALVGFAMLVLGYFGSKFVLEVLLDRSWS
jgi:ABC-type uncharacterized transport system permease subunit